MKALLTIDAPVFFRAPDGRVYTQSVATYDDYWSIPRQSFNEVLVMTRLRQIDQLDNTWRLADGDGVRFSSVPFYRGPLQYLLASRKIQLALKLALEECNVLLCNGPGTLSTVAINIAKDLNKLYALDVLADPYDVFAPGAMKHPLRPFFRWRNPRLLRKQCAGACAVNYVTREALQRRYPPAPQALSMGISDVHIPSSNIASKPRIFLNEKRTINLVFVGTLAQLYKAPDILIDAVAICVREGLDIKLTLLGDGKHRSELEARTVALGLDKRVQFLGLLPAGNAVRHELDKADIFVMPSYQEGLPKAMVEAMARALPCIGSNVGGIPELLPEEDMVMPGNAPVLAQKIREVVVDAERMTKMSAYNLKKANEYRQEVLREQRINFYYNVCKKTEEWIRQKR